ncbi:MAG TPA: hypothetical protein VNG13_01110 [Mycobacteriales bacterium]|nr:hypothetical protein [Mycobacteriales bacterium]
MPTGLDRDVLLSDAQVMHIRRAVPGDVTELRELPERLSLRSLYLRHFSGAPNVDADLAVLLRPAHADPPPAAAAAPTRPGAVWISRQPKGPR